jgi:hypothetical protein
VAKKTGLVLFLLLFVLLLFSGCVISPRRNPDGSLANPTPTPTPTATPTPTPVSTPTPTPTPAPATGKMYVTSFVDNKIFQFGNAFTANGNVAPAATIAGVATTLSGPVTLTLDAAADRLYVPNNTAGTISIFDSVSTANNNQAPTRTITGAATGLIKPVQIALDKAHDLLYVADDQNVIVFASASTVSGDATPARTIGVAFPISGMILDTAGDRLYLAFGGGNAINIYDSASTLTGTVTPSRQITGAAAALAAPEGLQLDSSGRLIVCNSVPPSLNVYNTVGGTVAGNLAPVATVSGSATALIAPSQIVYDSAGSGTLYVADPGAAAVLVFTSFNTATGNVAPSRTISGASTGLSVKGSNSGIALDTTR